MRLFVLAVALLTVAASAQEAPSFTEEDVTFESVEGVTLAGTVSVPEGAGPFPAVVLVSGSGLQDRDGASPALPGGLLIYRDMAHALAEAGVLVLRYDERGAGASTPGPDPQAVTSFDYADDVAAAVRTLDARPDVRWVGIVGHSEGGFVAPIVAGREDAVDGIVMVAGPAESGLETVLEQNRIGLAAAGVRPSAVDSFVVRVDSAFSVAARDADQPLSEEATEEVRRRMTAAFEGLPPSEAAKLRLTPAAVPLVVGQQMGAVASPWFRTFLALDPTDYIRELAVPALALFFELDTQVTPARNADPMRAALGASASPEWEVVTISGVNHLLQAAETGAASEYASLPPVLAPEPLAAIAGWILESAGTSGKTE